MSFGYRKTLIKGKILSIHKTPSGYMKVGLSNNGTRKYALVHRLVAQAFIPNPKNYQLVNHKDENKANNCVENLEWCTQKYNINYGTAKKRAKATFELNKTTGKTDIDKALMETHITKTALARGLGISKSTLKIWINSSRNGQHKQEMLEKINVLEDEWQKNNQKQINDLIEFRKEAKRIFR